MILAAALIADQYRTEIISFLPDSTFTVLHCAASEVFPDLLWIDWAEIGLIPLLNIVVRAGCLLHALFTGLY